MARNLVTELGVAFAFDVHVQNGGFKPKAFASGSLFEVPVLNLCFMEELRKSTAKGVSFGFSRSRSERYFSSPTSISSRAKPRPTAPSATGTT